MEMHAKNSHTQTHNVMPCQGRQEQHGVGGGMIEQNEFQEEE